MGMLALCREPSELPLGVAAAEDEPSLELCDLPEVASIRLRN